MIGPARCLDQYLIKVAIKKATIHSFAFDVPKNSANQTAERRLCKNRSLFWQWCFIKKRISILKNRFISTCWQFRK